MKELNNKNQYFNIIVTHWKLEARDHTKHKIEMFNNFYFETSFISLWRHFESIYFCLAATASLALLS